MTEILNKKKDWKCAPILTIKYYTNKLNVKIMILNNLVNLYCCYPLLSYTIFCSDYL